MSEIYDMLTFKQMEAFLWATRLKSFAEASRHLNVTQSTLSKRIAEFETALGGALFTRSGHGAVPTILGDDIRELVEQMLDLREALRARVEHDRPPKGKVAFGVTELGASLWLPKWVARMRANFPDVELEPYVDVSAPLLAGLRAGRIAMAVLPLAAADEGLTATEVARLEFALMASPVLDPPPRLDREALQQWPILAQSGGSGLTVHFDAWALAHGMTLRCSLASNSLVAISELVLAGLGTAFLPVERYLAHLVDGRLRRIDGPLPWPSLPYYLVARQGTPSRASEALQQTIIGTLGLCDENAAYREDPRLPPRQG